jgi:peptidoglycan/xylan/chitin deacetylase (PgdA/CDA1 family)
MNIFQKAISKALRETLTLLPFSWLIRYQKKILVLPFYHVISDERLPHVMHVFSYLNVSQFEKDLDFLQKHFTPITLSDLMESIKGMKEIPDKAFLISFDDGHSEIAHVVAPILKRRAIPAVFFLNDAFLDNRDMSFRYKVSLILNRLESPLTTEDISKLATVVKIQDPSLDKIKSAILKVKYQERLFLDELADVLQVDFQKYLQEKMPYVTSHEVQDLIDQGFMIGSHSLDHPLFRDLSLDEQLKQVLPSLENLKKQFRMPYNAFAFPFSDNGVSIDFYDKTHKNGEIEVSFGTAYFSKGKCVNNLQRQPMEGRSIHADKIYKGLFVEEIITKFQTKLHWI